ncbi:organic anion transporter 3-like [Haemaphysalis longicornis]
MLAVFTSIVHGLASSDLALPVDHWCRAPAAYADLPLETWKNASVPAVDGTDDVCSHCFRHDPPFPVPDDLGADNRTVVPCDAGWDYEPGAGERSIVSAWDLVCGRHRILSLLTSVYMAGGVLGGACAGVLADRIGRWTVLCIMIFLLILAGIGTAFAHSILAFALLRFVLSTTFTVTTLFAFSAELYPTVVRGAGVGFCYVSGHMGAMVGPFLNDVHSAELRGVAFSSVALLLLFLAFLAISLPETTKLPPANTMRGIMADKWKLHSPLRLARSHKAVQGPTKRRSSKTAAPKDSAGRRCGRTALAAKDNLSVPFGVGSTGIRPR